MEKQTRLQVSSSEGRRYRHPGGTGIVTRGAKIRHTRGASTKIFVIFRCKYKEKRHSQKLC